MTQQTKWWRNPYTWYLVVLGILNLLPILAPVLLALSKTAAIFGTISKLIYLVYSFTCHQFSHRSLYLFDYQYAWCARDVGIWLAVLLGALAVKRWKLQSIPLYWVIPFVVPIALDGGIQTVATLLGLQSPFGATSEILYVSNNFTRFVTGAIFGLGLSLFISPVLLEGSSVDLVGKFTNLASIGREHARVIAISLSITICCYIAAVFAWNITSQTHKPTDFLDSAVRTPADNLFVRRKDGVCPTVGEDLLNWECFVK